MPQKLPNNLQLSKLGNIAQNFIELLPSARSPSWNENFVITSKNLGKAEIELFIVRCFTCKLLPVVNVLWMIVSKSEESKCQGMNWNRVFRSYHHQKTIKSRQTLHEFFSMQECRGVLVLFKNAYRIFSQTCIVHHVWEKVSNLWYSPSCEMHWI